MSNLPFKRFGTQIDCSRNAVMSVDALKRWIDICSAMGHNVLMLYTEDTYEIDGHPYFGYGRGRYSKAELKELNAYALSKGIELIPSINTLAHLNTIFRWKQYADIHDCEDILLCEDERTYALVEDMIKTLADCYTSSIINVGMDEADMIGRGKYFDAHGEQKRIEIILRHLNKVSEIAKKYGKELLIYSDMLFALATHSEYADENAKVQEDVSHLIPDNVSLVYWNYYKREKEDYAKLIRINQEIKKEGLWYYGGVWNWFTFSPENSYSIAGFRNSIPACLETNVENVIISLWGDDGAECSRFAALPAVFYASELIKGNTDEASIKAKFEEMFGMPFDKFILLDLTTCNETEVYTSEPTRYILYNDPFIGLVETTIPDYAKKDHEELAKLLAPLRKHERWGYLFDTLHALCKVTALKCDIGTRIRDAYEKEDKAELVKVIADLRKLKRLVRQFYLAFRRQWMIENKGHGFDVSDIRIGGVMTRVEHCADRLQDYVDGKISQIEELEEKLLDIRPVDSSTYGVKKYLNYWDRAKRYSEVVTANVLSNGY